MTLASKSLVPLERCTNLNLEHIGHWSNDSNRLFRAKAMTLQAQNGLRRPFHIMVATNRIAPFVRIAESLIESTEMTNLLSAKTPEGRPIVRWTYIAMESEFSETITDEMSKALTLLSEVGVQTTLATSESTPGITSISSSRIAVLEYLRRHPEEDNPIIAWLDDDLSFETLVTRAGVPIETHAWSWLHEVWDFHDDNPAISIGLGDVTGAPPLPASSTITSSLRDLVASQQNLSIDADENRWSKFDYYYDLSEDRTDYSAWPMIVHVDEYSDCRLLHELLVDGSLSRPLVATPSSLSRARPGRYVRGGNTVIFDSKWIYEIDHPNISRRGDTIWALKAERLGAALGHFPIPLHHLRECMYADWTSRRSSVLSSWHNRIEADLIGSSIQRWLRNGMHADKEAIDILHSRASVLRASLIEAITYASLLENKCKEEILISLQSGIDTINCIINSPNQIRPLLKEMRHYMEA